MVVTTDSRARFIYSTQHLLVTSRPSGALGCLAELRSWMLTGRCFETHGLAGVFAAVSSDGVPVRGAMYRAAMRCAQLPAPGPGVVESRRAVYFGCVFALFCFVLMRFVLFLAFAPPPGGAEGSGEPEAVRRRDGGMHAAGEAKEKRKKEALLG